MAKEPWALASVACWANTWSSEAANASLRSADSLVEGPPPRLLAGSLDVSGIATEVPLSLIGPAHGGFPSTGCGSAPTPHLGAHQLLTGYILWLMMRVSLHAGLRDPIEGQATYEAGDGSRARLPWSADCDGLIATAGAAGGCAQFPPVPCSACSA